MSNPRLIIFSGLPGAGKTTLAKRMAVKLNAVYLRADTIESALKNGDLTQIDGLGYMVGYETAKENLELGNSVVADSVNPWQLTRNAWRQAAIDAGKPFFDIEVICSDAVEHRRRVEQRSVDIEGLELPTWQEVLERDYHPWKDARIQIDTSAMSVEDALERISEAVGD